MRKKITNYVIARSEATKQSHNVRRLLRLRLAMTPIIILLLFSLLPAKTEELKSIPTVGQFSYNIQKYTGFNFLVDHIAKMTIKGILKHKTKAKKVSVDLKIFSGWDLLKKKAKSFNVKAEELVIKKIPIAYFNLSTKGPIYFKKNPIDINASIQIKSDNVTELINDLSHHNSFNEFDLPLPPFGSTKVKLSDFYLTIDDNGSVWAKTVLRSVINPDSEPLKMNFSGNLVLKDKKIVIDNLKGEVEDIFTRDSDLEKSFSKMLEDLINPVINFHKYEKKGLTIDNVNLAFKANSLILEINSKLLPE